VTYVVSNTVSGKEVRRAPVRDILQIESAYTRI
jgi:hypothetical protein